MTRTTFLRFTMRHDSQRRLTDALTFMAGLVQVFGDKKSRWRSRSFPVRYLCTTVGGKVIRDCQAVKRHFYHDFILWQDANVWKWSFSIEGHWRECNAGGARNK